MGMVKLENTENTEIVRTNSYLPWLILNLAHAILKAFIGLPHHLWPTSMQ